MNDILRFHVPCKISYTKLVEDFTRHVSQYLNPKGGKDFVINLVSVMNEVFVNIVEHSKTALQKEVVRFQFEIGLKFFSISIYDYGPGFKAENILPPYPKLYIGQKFKLRDVLDGTVYYTILDSFSILFSFEANERIKPHPNFEKLKAHGLGMSIVTKLMDSVTYSYIGDGKFDWKLIKKLE